MPTDGPQAKPYSLNYELYARPVSSHSDVIGTLKPTMKLADRAVDWSTMSADEAARTVRFSDSSPGCPHTIGATKYRLFGAVAEGGVVGGCGERGARETEHVLARKGVEPGDPVGERIALSEKFCLDEVTQCGSLVLDDWSAQLDMVV